MSVLLHRVAFEDGLAIAQYESAQDDQMGFGTLGVRDGAPAVAAQAARPVTELLVQFRPGASAADQALAINNAGGSEASVIRSAADGDLLVIKVGGGRSTDARGVFYDDGRSNNQGFGNYARITDFSEGDRVQLAPGTYFLIAGTLNEINDTRIFHDIKGTGRYDSPDEAIAFVEGSKTLTMADIVFSTASPSPPPTPTPTNVIYGTDSPDKAILGTTGDDIISGVPTNSTALGTFTVDIITGNLGNDLFVLGDGRGVFYNDGRWDNAGAGDYARITDFSAGDRVQLTAGNYFLNQGTVGGFTGTRIWWDSNNNGKFETFDELIALVQGSKAITAADFVFVAPGSNAVGDIDPVGLEASVIDVGAFAPDGGGDMLAAFGAGPTWLNELGSAKLGFAHLQQQNIMIA